MKVNYDWAQIYREYHNSPLSKKELAERLGVHPTTIYKKFRAIENADIPAVKPVSDIPQIIPVEIVPEPTIKGTDIIHSDSIPSAIQISIGRATVSINSGCDLKLLRDVLRAVTEIC